MKVIIAAAGTGGHINPGIAIANKIVEKNPGSEIVFFGTKRGLENDLVPRAGYKLKHIEAYGIQPQISMKNFKQLMQTMHSTKKVIQFIDEFKPDIVIGTGGYICGPVFAAANARKIPAILHESNAYPGRAVKVFAKKADEVLVGFEDAKDRLKIAKKVVFTGTPTKIKKVNISSQNRNNILKSLGLNSSLPVVLVFGGSQGAKKINDILVDLVVNNMNKNYQLVWATGPKQFDYVEKKLFDAKIDVNNINNAKVLPYIYNMEELINIADLVVCRSGAMTVTELAIVEKPAIFVPLPSVGANRQEDNARSVEKINGARVILNDELTSNILNDTVNELISNKENLVQMGKNANKLAIDDVEGRIYAEIEKVVNIEKK